MAKIHDYVLPSDANIRMSVYPLTVLCLVPYERSCALVIVRLDVLAPALLLLNERRTIYKVLRKDA